MIHHFLLTRFNISLWKTDKHGERIDREHWLEERLPLFETYCLPSIVNQSCKEFTWVLLCEKPDNPEEAARFDAKIKAYREQCPQIFPVEVKAGNGFKYAQVFSEVVAQLLLQKGAKDGDICLTTYLDNDDALHQNFVSNTQDLVAKKAVQNPYFIAFDYGLQYFTEIQMATRIFYPNNHFMSCCERVEMSQKPRTCYGYGSHFLLEDKGLAQVEHIHDKTSPMWVEVIHNKNVDNDVKMTLDTHFVKNSLHETFGIEAPIQHHYTAYYLRYITQMWRRFKEKITPRKW